MPQTPKTRTPTSGCADSPLLLVRSSNNRRLRRQCHTDLCRDEYRSAYPKTMNQGSVDRLRLLLDEARSGALSTWSDLDAWREQVLAHLRGLLPAGHDRLDQFADYPTHTMYRRNLGYTSRGTPSEAEELQSKTTNLISLLAGMVTELRLAQPEEPVPTVEALHPWVAGALTGLWDGGYHRQAVDEATRAIEIRLKAKLGRLDHVTGAPLMADAFNPDPPRPGQKRLRFSAFSEGSAAWTNAHQGAMYFGMGCMHRIRNLYEHHDEEIDKELALECLAALSLLARWIDEAVVITG